MLFAISFSFLSAAAQKNLGRQAGQAGGRGRREEGAPPPPPAHKPEISELYNLTVFLH